MQYEDQQCCDCGVWFGVPTNYTRNRRGDRKTFYCPNGHGQSYKESEADKLRRERDRLAQQIAQKNDEILTRDKQIKRLHRRAAAGTCPCCQRTFSNMSRHMKTKHPEMVAENIVNIKRGLK